MLNDRIVELAKSEPLRGKVTREEFLITFARLIEAKTREDIKRENMRCYCDPKEIREQL